VTGLLNRRDAITLLVAVDGLSIKGHGVIVVII
jgi:hypothetical protein